MDLEGSILSDSDGLEEPTIGGSEQGYSDPGTFDPS